MFASDYSAESSQSLASRDNSQENSCDQTTMLLTFEAHRTHSPSLLHFPMSTNPINEALSNTAYSWITHVRPSYLVLLPLGLARFELQLAQARYLLQLINCSRTSSSAEVAKQYPCSQSFYKCRATLLAGPRRCWKR